MHWGGGLAWCWMWAAAANAVKILALARTVLLDNATTDAFHLTHPTQLYKETLASIVPRRQLAWEDWNTHDLVKVLPQLFDHIG